MKLVLVRHGESVWNKENRFTGWTDVELTENGIREAGNAGKALREGGFDFDICFTSYLKRAIHTLNIVLTEMDREWLPVQKSWKLNERHYGALQGLNKADTAAKYGEEQVEIWRRAYAVKPPALAEDDERNPAFAPQYRDVQNEILPLAESLEDTVARVVPYFMEEIAGQMRSGKRVLVAAHGNSLRALLKYFGNISDGEIVGVNIPTGIPLVCEFDETLALISQDYLADTTTVAAKMAQVANQGKASQK